MVPTVHLYPTARKPSRLATLGSDSQQPPHRHRCETRRLSIPVPQTGIGSKTVQGGTTRGWTERGTRASTVATNAFIRGAAKHHDMRCVPGAEPAAQGTSYPRVVRCCFRLDDLSWNESCHTPEQTTVSFLL